MRTLRCVGARTRSILRWGIRFAINSSYVCHYYVGNLKDDTLTIIDKRKRKIVRKARFTCEVNYECGYLNASTYTLYTHKQTLQVNEVCWDNSGDYFFLSTGQSNGSGTVEVMQFNKDTAALSGGVTVGLFSFFTPPVYDLYRTVQPVVITVQTLFRVA